MPGCEGLGSPVFHQPMQCLAVGPGLLLGLPSTPPPVLGSPAEDAHTYPHVHLPCIRSAACALSPLRAAQGPLALLGSGLSARSVLHRYLRRYLRLSAAGALLRLVPALPVVWEGAAPSPLAPSALAVPLLFLGLQP